MKITVVETIAYVSLTCVSDEGRVVVSVMGQTPDEVLRHGIAVARNDGRHWKKMRDMAAAKADDADDALSGLMRRLTVEQHGERGGRD